MKWLAVVFVLLMAACAHLPPMQPVDPPRRTSIIDRCRAIFPQGRWQLVHAIEAQFPGGRRTFLTGVVLLSATDARIHCVLMTLDGFVLFEAVDDGTVLVKRAFGPFDHAELARGMMADIRLMLLPPDGSIVGCGLFADEVEGCRFRTTGGGIVDVTIDANGGWRIERTSPPRTVTAPAVDRQGFAPTMILTAGGNAAYRLNLSLIDATALDTGGPLPEENQ